MVANTKIEWCDHTWNPWIGCTKVGPGCAHCYAENLMDKRMGVAVWGPGNERVRTKDANWKMPLRWNAQADAFMAQHGHRQRVFCASLADVFDNAVDPQWRADLFALIAATPNLDWLILTKRVGNVLPMIRLALEFVYKAHSTGYNKAHETSTTRTGSLRGRLIGRTRDRQVGPGMAPEEADIRPLDGRCQDDSLQSSQSRDGDGGRLFSGSLDAQRQAGGGSSSSAGVVSLQGSDSRRADHQPQERQQGEQQAKQLGVGDLQRAEEPRNSGTGREAPRCAGVEAPENTSERVGRDGNAKSAQERNDDKRHRNSVQCDAERSLTDLPQRDLDARPALKVWLEAWMAGQPPSNVWIGATIVNQVEADRDIPKLLDVPARVRFLSMEPLLGPVDLTHIEVFGGDAEIYPLKGTTDCVDEDGAPTDDVPALDWVIVGGESGPGARPMHPDWARSLRDQCEAAGVPFLFKQWGEWASVSTSPVHPESTRTPGNLCSVTLDGVTADHYVAISTDGGRTRNEIRRVGKKAAGRLLDGRTWDGFPAP